MSKIDLTSSEWCELIFQDRNRAYGAFKMRSESRKRHTWSMVSVVLLAGVACCIPTLIKLAAPNKADEKIVAIPVNDPFLNSYNDLGELPQHQFQEIKHFFEVYKYLENKETRVDNILGKQEAIDTVEKCKKAYKKRYSLI